MIANRGLRSELGILLHRRSCWGIRRRIEVHLVGGECVACAQMLCTGSIERGCSFVRSHIIEKSRPASRLHAFPTTQVQNKGTLFYPILKVSPYLRCRPPLATPACRKYVHLRRVCARSSDSSLLVCSSLHASHGVQRAEAEVVGQRYIKQRRAMQVRLQMQQRGGNMYHTHPISRGGVSSRYITYALLWFRIVGR